MRAISLLVLALMLLPAVDAADANRSSKSFTTAEPVDTTWLAARGNVFIAGTEDGTTTSGSNMERDQNVWYVYEYRGLNPSWSQTRVGAADRSTCTHTPPVATNCVGHVRAVATSRAAVGNDGVRFLVASVDANDNSLLNYHSTGLGPQISATIDGQEITSAAMSADGSTVVVGFSVPGGFGQPDTGAVKLYAWNSANPSWSKSIAEPVTSVAMNGAGDRILVAAGDLFSYSGAGIAAPDQLGAANVAEVAVSDATAQWGIAGYSTGDVNLYGLNSAGAAYIRQLNLRPDDAAITAADIRADGTIFATGDADGKLRVYATHTGQPSLTTLVNEFGPLSGAVHDIAISEDGKYMAVAAGMKVHFYRITTTAVTEYWQDTHAGAVSTVSINADGNQVIATVGASVSTYSAKRAVDIAMPAQPTPISPGGQGQATVTITNNGNRDETLSLAATPPAGWQVTVTPAQPSIAPGDSVSVKLNFQAAPEASAGNKTASFTVTGGAGQTSHELTLKVLQKRSWLLVPNGTANPGVEAGASVTMLVNVTNAGNSADETQLEVNLTKANWSAVVQPAMVSLGAGESEMVKVIISAPANAKELESAIIELSAAADPKTAITLTAVVGAHFGITFTGDGPTGALQPDSQSQFDVVVTNMGNAPDSIRLDVEGLPLGWKVIFPDDPYTLYNLQPGASQAVPVTLEVDDDAQPANYQFRLRATSLGDSEQTQVLTFTVGVDDAPAGGSDEEGPAAPLFALVLGLLAITVARRTRP